MSLKEITAAIALVVEIAIGFWVIARIASGEALQHNVQDAAIQILWAVGAMIVIIVVAAIVGAIAMTIAQGEEVVDDKDDERDRAIGARSSRNAYTAMSLGIAGTVILLATGTDPVLGVYCIFGAMLLGGITDVGSQLIYYQIG